VTLAGFPETTVTDGTGAYTATVNYGWSGTVTPAHAYYTFDPESSTYTKVTADTPDQNYAASLITTPQRQALIAFYDSTNGDSWTHNTGWETPPLYPDGFAMPGTEGTWYGVTVDSNSRVIRIELTDNNLTGSIPAALASLVDLEYLALDLNHIGGSIPAELRYLNKLQTLILSSNQLTGQIPIELGNLISLRTLLLSNNQLSGPLPGELENLVNLVSLYADNNQLTGSIPIELGNLAQLWHLYLSQNQLSGPIPSQLGNAVNLRALHLEQNQLSGSIPTELGSLTNLVELRLNSNQLTGNIPGSLANLIYLTPSYQTDFGYNALYATDPDLTTFLNTKDPDWASTQTIAPTEVTATSLDNAVILVSWLPITYTGDTGSYNLYMSQIAGGPYTLVGQTADKMTTSLQVTNLTPAQRYYFVVRTQTNAHVLNENVVESGNSAEVSAVAWTQINVRIAGTVTLGGSPLSGVVMNGLPGNPATNTSGVYDVSVAAGSTVTVTPTLEGYTFVPASRTYTSVMIDQLNQDYAATVIVVPTITITSPNGGESWAVGSSHNITWTQTGMTGSVTIDLYKSGVYQKTLGTPDATASTYSWSIGGSETAGTDYRILVWQTGASDDSDADFAIVRAVRVDFNRDGQEDLLWRYYGEGGYNRVWFLGSSEGAGQPLAVLNTQSDAAASGSKVMGKSVSKTLLSDPRDIGILSDRIQRLSTDDAQGLMGAKNGQATTIALVDDPRKVARLNSKSDDFAVPPSITDPRQLSSSLAMKMSSDSIASAAVTKTWLGGADLLPVGDLNWQVRGTGDFNGDGYVDILWRYNGPGGSNVVWYMNGTDWIGSAELIPVDDANWQIVGTGDFNKDGNIDILWRNNSSGSNVVWYMNGTDWIGSAELITVSDLNWQIVGTGDFNKDGNVDILWRYNEGPGQVYVWYMDGATWIGGGDLISVADLNWQIAGTGDFNNDGNIDILWRYNGIGGYVYIWYLDGVTWIGGGDLLPVGNLTWKIVSR
jgi:hypothetical protein